MFFYVAIENSRDPQGHFDTSQSDAEFGFILELVNKNQSKHGRKFIKQPYSVVLDNVPQVLTHPSAFFLRCFERRPENFP